MWYDAVTAPRKQQWLHFNININMSCFSLIFTYINMAIMLIKLFKINRNILTADPFSFLHLFRCLLSILYLWVLWHGQINCLKKFFFFLSDSILNSEKTRMDQSWLCSLEIFQLICLTNNMKLFFLNSLMKVSYWMSI